MQEIYIVDALTVVLRIGEELQPSLVEDGLIVAVSSVEKSYEALMIDFQQRTVPECDDFHRLLR